MQHLLQFLIGTSIAGIFAVVLCFSLGCASDSIDRQKINQEAAPAEGESIPAKAALSYHVLCDLGDGYYLVKVRMGGAFSSAPMRLHRDELSKLRRVK